MLTKLIYFVVGDKEEKAEFSINCSTDDVKSIFRGAAEAGPNDILKLYNANGSIVSISPNLRENSSNYPYRLEVISNLYGSSFTKELSVDLATFEDRIQNLEKAVFVMSGETPNIVYEIHKKLDDIIHKVDAMEHLSYLGLFKNLSSESTFRIFWNKGIAIHKNPERSKFVFKRYLKRSKHLSHDICSMLRKPSFDSWQWEEAELLVLLQQMFTDLNLLETCKIELITLQKFLFEVSINYNNIPFHNFRHGFSVTQMMYCLIWMAELQKRVSNLDILILLVASICHDLDHPGFSNTYHINAQTALARTYNDHSPLENHHSAMAFEIMNKEFCNIFQNLSPEEFKKARSGIIRCILATDMACHSKILKQFRSYTQIFDFVNTEHLNSLYMILIKVSDLSNEARPLNIAEPWLDCLLQEFFNQGDIEKFEGLPCAPLMDRDKETRSTSQVDFISYVVLPLYKALTEVFPVMEGELIAPVEEALEYYTQIGKDLKEKNKREHLTSTLPV